MAVLKNKVELKNVSKVYETRDKQVEVLNNLSFEVHENEFLVLLGPGRCGKTVLLNILANLEKQTSGTIEFAGGRPKMGDLGMDSEIRSVPMENSYGKRRDEPEVKRR